MSRNLLPLSIAEVRVGKLFLPESRRQTKAKTSKVEEFLSPFDFAVLLK
jgi:hypothetical protein